LSGLGDPRRWLDLAFALAERGRIGTSPNPMVGAIVVSAGRLVGQGWHRRAGEPHAEIVALEEAGAQAREATLYVTLEPCCHTGRTPPCVESIIAAGIRRVVAAATDANPRMSGEGFRKLEAAGIEIVRDLDAPREALLNERFRRWVTSRRPFVSLKLAASLDGKVATSAGESKWITGTGARGRVQFLREVYDAVAVGIGTILEDDPFLTRRLGWKKERPLLRVVFDRTLRLPLHARIFQDPSPVLVVTMDPPDWQLAEHLRRKGAEVLPVPGGETGVRLLLEELGKREVTGLLLEGGPTLAASFLSAGLVDRWIGFLAPIVLGGERARSAIGGVGFESLAGAPRLRESRVEAIGSDWMLTGVF